MSYRTPKEVAKELKLSPQTITHHARKGHIRAKRLGRAWLIEWPLVSESLKTVENG